MIKSVLIEWKIDSDFKMSTISSLFNYLMYDIGHIASKVTGDVAKQASGRTAEGFLSELVTDVLEEVLEPIEAVWSKLLDVVDTTIALPAIGMSIVEFKDLSLMETLIGLKSLNCIHSVVRDEWTTDERYDSFKIEEDIDEGDEKEAEHWYLDQMNIGNINAPLAGEYPNRVKTVVAVIDSGCSSHGEYNDQFWVNPQEACSNGADDDGNGLIDDCHGWNFVHSNPNTEIESLEEGSSYGHGTGVSGIISGKPDRYGVDGLCPTCEIMCLKFMDGGKGRISDQIKAIEYAVRKGVRISNNSYGGYGRNGAEYEAVKRAVKKGHLFVTTAGNRGRNNDRYQDNASLHSPSDYDFDGVVAVGATDDEGKRVWFSNFGYESVDVFAPGQFIITSSPGGGYKKQSGTSYAAPMVTGVLAQMMSSFPMLTRTDYINCLKCSEDNLNAGYSRKCSGHLDFRASMECVSNITAGPELNFNYDLNY